MSKLLLFVLIACLPVFVLAQAPLPEKLAVKVFPDNLGGNRGMQVDITQIVQTGNIVTARITMFGSGQDRCRIKDHPAEGTFDGSKLLVRAVVDSGDNVTCPMNFELTRSENGKFEGRYTNAKYAGNVKAR
jgi:hypothetical protein